jgi:ABC-type transporter Mla subunit MlaD
VTTERWTDERLDRLASVVEAHDRQIERNSQLIERNSQLIEQNSKQILDLRSSIASLVRVVGQHQDNFEIMLAEIRGLRTENRRIIDQLFNREGD